MLDQLFNSKTRVAILALFFSDEDKSRYVQEIIKLSKTDASNAHRELGRLEELGILKSEKKGNQKYYYLNKDNAFFDGLKKLFEARLAKAGAWEMMEEMPNAYPMIVANAMNIKIANDFFASIGIKNRFSSLLTVYENNGCFTWWIKKDFDAIANEIVGRLIEEPKWGESYNNLIRKRQKELNKATDDLEKNNFAEFSNKELNNIYEDYYEIYENLHGRLHWFQTALDFGENVFSKYLMKYLQDNIKEKKYSVGEIFSILTTPTEEGNQAKEYRSLLNILDYIYNHRLKDYFKKTETRLIVDGLSGRDSKLDAMLKDHEKKYGWLGYGLAGPGWDKKYFIDILCSLVRQGAQPEKLLANIEKEKNELIEKQEQYLKLFEIDEAHQKLFKMARDTVYLKGSRKDSMFRSFSVIENLYREIAKRYYLSLNQVRYLYPHEIGRLLTEGNFSAEDLNARIRFSIHHSLGGYEDDVIISGDKAKKYLQKFTFIEESFSDIKLLQGDCASPGRVRGTVAVVKTVGDMAKVDQIKKPILVSIATNPDLVPAIKKSVAIITDVGGITCHAAIISRELGIPCVIGTKIATKALKDGDVVDVDATHGKVTIIEKQK